MEIQGLKSVRLTARSKDTAVSGGLKPFSCHLFSSLAQWNKGSLIKYNRFGTPTPEEHIRVPLETDLLSSNGDSASSSQNSGLSAFSLETRSTLP